MCQSVIPSGRSRLTIWRSEDYYNRWAFWKGSGMTLGWTSLWAFHRLSTSLTWFGWLWIDSPNPPTSYCQHQLQCSEVCRDLHRSCVMYAWSSEDNHLWSRVVVCCSLLGAVAHVPQDSLDPQFGLLPTDGWSNRASEPNSGGYAEGMHDGTSR
jgi:hypothetical protein